MKRLARVTLIWLLCAGMSCDAALAQAGLAGSGLGDLVNGGEGTHEVEVKPPENLMSPLPTKPVTPMTTHQEMKIPELPPALPCKKEWLVGIWQLQHVYQSPVGSEIDAYNLSPVQYIGFGREARFFRYNAGRTAMPPVEVSKHMQAHGGAILQYVLQDAGMLYLYKDSTATDTLVCFVVAETRPPYGAGNLLLMPPKGAINGRLIKVYKKILSFHLTPLPAKPPAGNRWR